MKYPQLVSTKAVNEISDWLIKRLEDLDIEHPNVYSRLLLSLLHTPLKVNAIDLIEDLKQPYRLMNKNNEELKRLAAVESLMELSAEENKSSIVNLVDELHSKLRKLESNSEEISMSGNNRATVNSTSSPISSSTSSSSSSSLSANSKLNKNLKKIKRNHGAENPTKNYYLAFPALNSNKMASSTTSKSATITCNDGGDLVEKKETNFNLLSWSKLMSNKTPSLANSNEQEKTSFQHEKKQQYQQQQQHERRKQKRYEKACGTSRRLSKATNNAIDVQFATKSLKLYDNATFSPKKMQMVKSNNANNHKKAKHQRNNYDSSVKRIVTDNNNNKHCDVVVRNTYFSNIAQNAPKLDGTTARGPWDMDFKGHWEMDRDLIGEFIQQQKKDGKDEDDLKKIVSLQNYKDNNNFETAVITADDDDDIMLMKCLPTKLIDEYDEYLDESVVCINKPFSNNKEALSISSLTSKFDDNVKAIWSDGGNEPLKPLTHKAYGGSNASLASSFMSDKNSLSLFNFETTLPMSSSSSSSLQYFNKNFIEVIAPPADAPALPLPPLSSTSSLLAYSGKGCGAIDYNNNNHSFFNGGRGVNLLSVDYSSYNASPYKQQQQQASDYHTGKNSDFIKSGTNLQASIWSDGGGFTSDSECLILKEVVDEVDSTPASSNESNKKLSSIGTELKQWQNSNDNEHCDDDEDMEVSLINHSAEKSAFKKFKPLIGATIIRANYHPLNKSGSSSSSSQSHDHAAGVVVGGEKENLYHSEKTHFSPINRNGLTFPVDPSWEEIKWERSASGGGYYYKNRRYQTRQFHHISMNDTIMMIDFDALEGNDDENLKKKKEPGLEVRFLMSDNDKGCQTDDNDLIMQLNVGRSYLEINEEYCRRKIYDEYFKGENHNKWRCFGDSNNHSFFSVNRVKSSPLPPSGPLAPPISSFLSSNSSSSSICTITSTTYDHHQYENVEDPFESWRNLNADQEHKDNCGHGLWEQCIACAHNNEDSFIEKPVPANRLLKDELQLDGDEIMNVIQNLYITSDYCEDDEEEKDYDCDGFDMNHVMNIISMDDSMDGVDVNEEEEEGKFYEEEVAGKNQMNNLINIDDFDDIALTKMQNAMDNDQERCIKFFKWIQSTLAHNTAAKTTSATVAATKTTTTADANNNECSGLSEVHRPTKNRKRRHSTCQNLMMEKRRYDSQEQQGYTYHLNLDSTPTFDDYNNLFFDAAKMLKINIEKILLIPHNDPSCLEMAGYKEHQDDHEEQQQNYYRNILQQQHALVKHLDLSRPLTR